MGDEGGGCHTYPVNYDGLIKGERFLDERSMEDNRKLLKGTFNGRQTV